MLSVTSLAVAAYSSVLHVRGFHGTKTHLDFGNSYADNLSVSNCLRIAVMLPLNALTDNEVVTSCAWSR